MQASLACAELPCNDVNAVSALLVFLPLAALVAFALAWPVARPVRRRPILGSVLVLGGLVGFVWFSSSSIAAVVGAVALGVLGLAFLRGQPARTIQQP